MAALGLLTQFGESMAGGREQRFNARALTRSD
jgi:hypothetical protein